MGMNGLQRSQTGITEAIVHIVKGICCTRDLTTLLAIILSWRKSGLKGMLRKEQMKSFQSHEKMSGGGAGYVDTSGWR